MSSDPAQPSNTEHGSELIDDLEFDLRAQRARYREERDRRLRPDGEDQFIRTGGEYGRFKDVDPYAPRAPRPALLIAGIFSAGGKLQYSGFSRR
jgi:hypothetical protein